ncbi:hypothetical protein QBC46DRAFT_447623 [Diplogelasinospora grovesii]|uniref:DUF6546 domain-containing protein n=1 Tax=Diplogelasinospora grovesii TaxID=303347 RepID=A0AAN6S684_9PEZI|nr:hypothetical protein QBC46DRAFT_447623 [Diplogelasinospora grovesii]
MPSWNRLPPEIRLWILKEVAGNPAYPHDRTPTPRNRLASHATVCKEWQRSFEPIIFKQLNLSPQCIFDLERIARHRLRLVRHIWLRLTVSTYSCDDCEEIDSGATFVTDALAVWANLNSLFCILSRWERGTPSAAGDGLTLELSIHSPSDCQHFFKHETIQSFSFTDTARLDSVPKALSQNNAFNADHVWIDRLNSVASWLPLHLMNIEPRLKVFGFPLKLFKFKKAARVEVVTGFLVRRNFYRSFHSEGLRELFQCLPNLEHIDIESWRYPVDFLGLRLLVSAQDKEQLWESDLPSQLKRISLFEDDDGTYQLLGARPRGNRPEMAAALVKASHSLEAWSASFVMDAYDAFQPFSPKDIRIRGARLPEWPNLKFVALTSNHFSPIEHPSKIEDFLLAAAEAARRMPLLEVMELWNAEPEVSIFRYARDRGDRGLATITVKTSWDFAPEESVIRCWSKTAEEHRCTEFSVKIDVLSKPVISPRLLALEHLQLRDLILHPLSFQQLRQDAIDAYTSVQRHELELAERAWLARSRTRSLSWP